MPKINNFQLRLVNFIKTQLNYFISTNDISSPTHLVDIEEEVRVDFDELNEEQQNLIAEKVQEIYWLLRQFDSK